MSPITPPIQPTTITADMLWDLTRQYPEAEQRIWRGAEMVQAGYVERARHGPAGLFLVRSAENPNTSYTVDQYGCSCWDYQKRGGLCKHRAARALFLASERAEADAGQAGSDEEPDPAARYALTGRGYLALVPRAALPAPVGTITVASRPLSGAAAVAYEELFGGDAA
jgi:hypothetical protein